MNVRINVCLVEEVEEAEMNQVHCAHKHETTT